MRNNILKNFTVGLVLFATMFLVNTFQVFAAVERSVVLPGGVSANTEVSALVHNSLPVTVRLKMKRDGSDNNFAERRARFILISPNGATETEIRSIGSTQETFEINLPAAGGDNACRTWRVRVVNFEQGANEEVSQAIRGSVEFFTTGSQTKTISAPNKFGLVQSGSVDKTISMPFTGDLTVQANWDTDELTLENFQLTFELYKGSTKLDSDTGYSRDSIILGISDSQRMKITYKVKASDFAIPGDWKIRVKGSIKGKVKNIDLKMKISDGLYE